MTNVKTHPSRRGFLAGVAGITVGGASNCHRSDANEVALSSHKSLTQSNTAPAASHVATASRPSPAKSGERQAAAPKRPLGKTGEMVSMLGLGGSHIGYSKLDDDDAIRLMRRAIDGGITFMDNCWDYNDGRSEERMGKALADGYRERVFLMTKLDGRTRDAARDQLGQSLARLKTDHIDLVQVHEVIREEDPGRVFARDGAIAALIEARREGKLKYIGFTGHKDPKIHLLMLETAKKHDFHFDTVQMPLNVMDAHYQSFQKAVLPVLLERGIGVLGMKSMGSGDILKSGVVTAPECLRYALSLPTSVVITGIDSDEVLDQDLDILHSFQPLAEKEREALLARALDPAQGGRYELFKTSHKYDGTQQNPHWLEGAKI